MARARASTSAAEVTLYGPVKALLEAQGYEVKGEIGGCDIVAVRGDEPPVIVELKRAFGLGLVLQGIDRLEVSDAVYLAVGSPPRRIVDARRLCRRLGLGLMVVGPGGVEVMVDPVPYRPRANRRRAARLLREHQRRVGDPTPGGITRRPIMTAYRQEALRCARLLADGPRTVREVRAAGDNPNAGRVLLRDAYGWFERVGRGVYRLTPRGALALDGDGGERSGERPADPPRPSRP